jgi:hypothetical protein
MLSTVVIFFLWDLLTPSPFFPFAVISSQHYSLFYVMSSLKFFFNIFSLSAFFPFNVMSDSALIISTFCPVCVFFTFFYFNILSVNLWRNTVWTIYRLGGSRVVPLNHRWISTSILLSAISDIRHRHPTLTSVIPISGKNVSDWKPSFRYRKCSDIDIRVHSNIQH